MAIMHLSKILPASVALLALTTVTAFSHASLETGEAQPGSYKAVMRIPHGCDGQATEAVRIDLPDGFIGAKPMPKPGWEIETETGDFDQSYELHGQSVASGVTAVTWSGGRLDDGHYDEFVIAGTIAGDRSGAVLTFPTTQTCADGSVTWVEIAEPGKDPHSLQFPAPTLSVAADMGGDAHHHAHGASDHASMPAEPDSVSVGDLTISGFWTRATLPNQRVGGGYMTIENTGDSDDRLVSVTSSVTERSEIHTMTMTNDVMTMRRVDDGLAIPAGESVALEPGGYHLMFQDLDEAFVEGESVTVTLTFERAGAIDIELPVHARDGEAQDHGGHHEH